MATTIREQVAELRKQIKAKCPTVRVEMGRGTAYGYVDIWSHDKGAMFTEQERAQLKAMGLSLGGNFCGISSDEVEYWTKKLAGTLTEADIEAARRRAEYRSWD